MYKKMRNNGKAKEENEEKWKQWNREGEKWGKIKI